MQPSCTIVYYTANQEQPEFEQKVVDQILAVKGSLPVISVSQKPMDFGENICVGDVGRTYLNAFRQLLIGCEKTTSKFIFTAESDCLYPPGYFNFVPKDERSIYSHTNTWVLWKRGNDKYYYKEQTHAGMVYGREFLIKFLNESFKGLPMWSREKVGFPFYKKDQEFIYFSTLPIVSMKTGDGIQKGTRTDPRVSPKRVLEYWGDAHSLKERIFNEYAQAHS